MVYIELILILYSKIYSKSIKIVLKNNVIIICELEYNKGSTSIEFREKMSSEAFSETAYYDAVISNYFNKIKKTNFPKKKIIYGNLIEKLQRMKNELKWGSSFAYAFAAKNGNARVPWKHANTAGRRRLCSQEFAAFP